MAIPQTFTRSNTQTSYTPTTSFSDPPYPTNPAGGNLTIAQQNANFAWLTAELAKLDKLPFNTAVNQMYVDLGIVAQNFAPGSAPSRAGQIGMQKNNQFWTQQPAGTTQAGGKMYDEDGNLVDGGSIPPGGFDPSKTSFDQLPKSMGGTGFVEMVAPPGWSPDNPYGTGIAAGAASGVAAAGYGGGSGGIGASAGGGGLQASGQFTGEGSDLNSLVSFIQSTWPQLAGELTPDRIAGWQDELQNGTGRGRDYAALRADIMRYVVGEDNLFNYVKTQFRDGYGLTIETPTELASSRVNRIVSEIIGGRTFDNLNNSLAGLAQQAGTTGTNNAGGGVGPGGSGGSGGDVIPGDDVIQPQGAGGGFPGVMAGGTLHRIFNPAGQVDYYVISYEYPPGSGHSFFYRFNDVATLEQTIGPNLGGGKIPMGPSMQESDLLAWTDGGDSNEIMGVQGSFGGYLDDMIRDLSVAGGLGDPARIGGMMRDPGMMLILAKATEGNWTQLQTKAAMRKEDYYKDVMYPGIENFYGQSDNPEALYAVYKQNVEAVSKSLGLPRDGDGSYDQTIRQLLDAGVSDQAYANFAPTYKKAQANIQYAGALSKWTELYAGQPISTFEDYFDVLAGNAPERINEIAEVAGLQFMADNAGFNITDTQLRTIGEAVNLTEEQAGQVFSNTARSLLSLGARGLRRGGLDANQILEAEAGFGGNIEAVKARMRKLAVEEGLVDDPQASIFTDFNREGAPIKSSLVSSVSEGA